MFQRITKYNIFLLSAITALITFVTLLPKFPAVSIAESYVPIRFEDFVIMVVLLFFLPIFFLYFKKIFSHQIPRVIFIYLLIGFTSLMSAIFVTHTVGPMVGLLHFLRRIEYMSLFFVGFIFVYKYAKKGFFGYLFKLLLIINLLVFVYAIGQRFFEFPVIITQNEEYSKGIALRWVPGAHINSTFAGHYDLASYVVLTSPFIFLAFIFAKDKITKILSAASSVMSFILLTLAVSRISIVSFILSITLVLVFYKKFKELVIFLVVSVMIFGSSPDLQVRYNRILQVIKEKVSMVLIVQASENGIVEDRSSSIRFNVEWPRAIRAFSKNPLLGTGYSSITLATDNDYLRALGEVGLLGFSAFGLIFISLFQKLLLVYKNFKTRLMKVNFSNLFVVAFYSSTIAIFVTAIFIDIFEASKFATIYWLFAGFVMARLEKLRENI